jgi:hypothetical protein
LLSSFIRGLGRSDADAQTYDHSKIVDSFQGIAKENTPLKSLGAFAFSQQFFIHEF